MPCSRKPCVLPVRAGADTKPSIVIHHPSIMTQPLRKLVVPFTLLLALGAIPAFGGTATTFTFKITEVQSSKATAAGFLPKVAIPKSIPKFKKGRKIKFTLKADGKLTGP